MNAQAAPSFSVAESLRFGWNQTQAHLKPMLIIGASSAFLAALNQALTRGHGANGLLILGVQVLQAMVVMVLIRAALRLADGQPFDLSSPGALLTGFLNYLLTSALFGLIVLCGLILLIAPGVVWLLRYCFAGFLAVDRQLHPLEALRESRRITNGARGQLLVFGLACAGVNLLGAIALGVGLLFTVPTTCIAAAHVLRQLQARVSSEAQPGGPIGLAPHPAGA